MKFIKTLLLFIFFSNNLSAQIPAPKLRCVKNDTLTWELPTVSCGAIRGYNIYVASNYLGPYQLLANIVNPNQKTYFHNTVDVFTRYYYVQTVANCAGQTPLSSDTINNLRPQTVSISTLNVLDNKTVEVRWTKSNDPKVVGYLIYRRTNAGLLPISTVPNRDTISFLDRKATPDLKSEDYQVAAIDACGNASDYALSQQTVFLKAKQSACDQNITLKWNLYKNWTNPISSHEIWLSTNGRATVRLTSVLGTDTAFVFKNVKNKSTYKFYLRAIQSVTSILSKSNDTTIVADILEPVRRLYLKKLSVNKKNQVEVIWAWNADARVDSVQILRGSADASLAAVTNFKSNSPLDDDGYLLDSTANAGLKPLTYRVKTLDLCKNQLTSNYGTTIHLQGFPQTGQQSILSWTPLVLEQGIVTSYQVVRIVNGLATNTGAALDTGKMREYIDLVNPEEPRVCYRIAASYRYPLADGTEEDGVSLSNTVCVDQFVGLYMPNAFAPEGINSIFRPVFSFTENIKEYSMEIFDRWGAKMFETTTPNIGWDGKVNGSAVPQGTYIYRVKAGQLNGGLLEQRGFVMLIR